MGLKHLPLVSIMFFILSILTGITFGGQSMSGELKCLGFLVKGKRKMLINFAMVIEVAFVPRT